MKRVLFAFFALCALVSCTPKYDVLIIGGGASGTAAGLQSARMGTKTLIVEETAWIGGMLTAAGVSAVDGNYRLRGGIFGEFLDALAEHYGGYDKLKTGWVSNTLFEPSVGEGIFEEWVAAEPKLDLIKGYRMESVQKLSKGWKVAFVPMCCCGDGKPFEVVCKVLIDGTELGDVAKACGVKYHIGFDPKCYTGEELALEQGNDLVQDLTMVMTLKDYGPDADMTIPKPEGYNRDDYNNSCINKYNTYFEKAQKQWPSDFMLEYGHLPNGKYMINWPVEGNDFYENIIEMSREQRDSVIAVAKQRTLGFLYFLQHDLGYKHLGLADDEYPTKDKLAFFPYHRESRRIEGEHLFILDEAANRYMNNAYRTGTAVGDYPVDHHHYASPQWKEFCKFWFSPVPSFSVPAGCLVPLVVEDLIVAEKSISVSNLVNGTTRLQPVVLEIGQCAGVIASLACKNKCAVREVGVRDIQKVLLGAGAYLQPYLDIKPGEDGYLAIQRVGSTGILRGEGRNVAWSNETWFHINEPLKWSDLYLEDYYGIAHCDCDGIATVREFEELLGKCGASSTDTGIEDKGAQITRLQAAVAIDRLLNPFERDVDFHGNLK